MFCAISCSSLLLILIHIEDHRCRDNILMNQAIIQLKLCFTFPHIGDISQIIG